MDCLFCKIVSGEIKSNKIYEDELTYAFLDIFPVTKGHSLVIPKNHAQHIEELDEVSRNRIFNLGYYTWVEQQGVSAEDFEARRSPEFWQELHQMSSDWDGMIEEFNKRTGVTIG